MRGGSIVMETEAVYSSVWGVWGAVSGRGRIAGMHNRESVYARYIEFSAGDECIVTCLTPLGLHPIRMGMIKFGVVRKRLRMVNFLVGYEKQV